MSGGSFNYLCSKDIHDIARGVGEEWDWMLDELDCLAPEIAADMRLIREHSVKFVMDNESRWAKLQPVLHAIEWWRSMDWSKDQVDEAITKYKEQLNESIQD